MIWIIIIAVGLLILFTMKNNKNQEPQIKTPSAYSGNSRVTPILNDFTDVANLVESEKYFNKGTELFNNGDYSNAVTYFEKAGDLGDKDALYQLGNAYLQGKGVSQNLHKSFYYYLKSANLNHEKAQYNVGLFHLQGKLGNQNIEEGVNWIKKSASNGYPEAKQILHDITKN